MTVQNDAAHDRLIHRRGDAPGTARQLVLETGAGFHTPA